MVQSTAELEASCRHFHTPCFNCVGMTKACDETYNVSALSKVFTGMLVQESQQIYRCNVFDLVLLVEYFLCQ